MVVKDAVCDSFRAIHNGMRPSVDKDDPDVRIYVKLENERLFLSLDTSGNALHERGYRARTDHEAPMKEHLAAGLLRLAGWADFCKHLHSGKTSCYLWSRVSENERPQLVRPGMQRRVGHHRRPGAPMALERTPASSRPSDIGETEGGRRIPAHLPFSGGFLDPMCGSGTLVIEAARMLLAMPLCRSWEELGVSRLLCAARQKHVFDSVAAAAGKASHSPQVALQRLKAYQMRHAQFLQGTGPSALLCGSDLSQESVREARANAERAGVSPITTFRVADFRQVSPSCAGSLVVLNPPYNRRLARGFEYKQYGDTFKQRYGGSTAWLISADLDELKNVGLRPTRRHTVFNGQLEARYCQYVIYR